MMAKGTVKWFNPTKGYGFIQPQGGGGGDVFVHISAVERAGLSTLNEGQQVEYEIVSNRGKSMSWLLSGSRRTIAPPPPQPRGGTTALAGERTAGPKAGAASA
jgi:CspA family cold shock protein